MRLLRIVLLFGLLVQGSSAIGCDLLAAAIPSAGPVRMNLENRSFTSFPRISPSGTQVAFVNSGGDISSVGVVSLVPKCARVDVPVPTGMQPLFVAWSQGGKLYLVANPGPAMPPTVLAVDAEHEVIKSAVPPDFRPGGSYATTSNQFAFASISFLDATGQQLFWNFKLGKLEAKGQPGILVPLAGNSAGIAGISIVPNEDKRDWVAIGRDGAKVLFEFDQYDIRHHSQFLGISADEASAYYLSSANSDAVNLYRAEISSGKTSKLFQADSDLQSVSLDPLTGAPDIVYWDPDLPKGKALEKQVEPDFDWLSQASKGMYPIVLDRSFDDRYWLVSERSSQLPPSWSILDRSTHVMTSLGSTVAPVSTESRLHTEAYETRSRDGLKLLSYVTTDDAVCPKSCPTLFDIHGGPGTRDYALYEPYRAWLASLGYRIVQVNFRGSSGFGRRFELLDKHNWGTRMQEDVENVYDDLMGRKIIDKPVAVMGASYGGYAALNALERSNRFSAGIAESSVSDLRSFVQYHLDHDHGVTDLLGRVGNPGDPDDAAEMLHRSPISAVNKLTQPVLLMGGVNDYLSPPSLNTGFWDALSKSNERAVMVIFPDAGHGLSGVERSERVLVESFLAQYLSGRYAPVTDDEKAEIAKGQWSFHSDATTGPFSDLESDLEFKK